MLWRLIIQIIAGILGLWLADRFVSGVEFTGPLFILPRSSQQLGDFLGTLFFVGAILGFLNFFVKPVLKGITLPLRIITFNLFSLVLAMLMVWITDVIFPELIIQGLLALFWTTLIVWAIALLLEKWLPEES